MLGHLSGIRRNDLPRRRRERPGHSLDSRQRPRAFNLVVDVGDGGAKIALQHGQFGVELSLEPIAEAVGKGSANLLRKPLELSCR